jgi:hypothetical protein
MKTFFLVVAVFWMGIGLWTLREEMEHGNEKVLNMKFQEGIKVFFKALFFGPYTRSKVLAKL